ncbi:putative Pre-SET protein [Hordeum vulgare]|nr:putative Pre-SET protein [Hordeum vulgare]
MGEAQDIRRDAAALARPACTGCRSLAPIAARSEKDRGEAQDIGRDAAAAARSPGDKNRKIQHCRNREMPTLSVERANNTMNNGMGSGVRNMQEVPCLDVDLASSPRGDVKMSLKFSVDPSKFHMPDLEAVFKMVEKKCLRSSDFSIHGILTEMCQCVVQLGTEHTVEHNTQSDIVGNGSLSENSINRKQKAREEPLVLKGLETDPTNSQPCPATPFGTFHIEDYP